MNAQTVSSFPLKKVIEWILNCILIVLAGWYLMRGIDLAYTLSRNAEIYAGASYEFIFVLALLVLILPAAVISLIWFVNDDFGQVRTSMPIFSRLQTWIRPFVNIWLPTFVMLWLWLLSVLITTIIPLLYTEGFVPNWSVLLTKEGNILSPGTRFPVDIRSRPGVIVPVGVFWPEFEIVVPEKESEGVILHRRVQVKLTAYLKDGQSFRQLIQSVGAPALGMQLNKTERNETQRELFAQRVFSAMDFKTPSDELVRLVDERKIGADSSTLRIHYAELLRKQALLSWVAELRIDRIGISEVRLEQKH